MSFQYLKRGALHLARTHNLARTRQALAILASSAAIGAILAWLRVPAALLLGPMLAGIAIAAGGSTARVPNAAFLVAQGIIGCMIAKVVPLSIAGEILGHWPVFVFGVLAVIASSALLGWLMTGPPISPRVRVALIRSPSLRPRAKSTCPSSWPCRPPAFSR
jgi:uncharacterized membrane protein AbrB (regulator of aidB expression)